MPTNILCFAVGAIMIAAAAIQVQLTARFWDTFHGTDPAIKALVVGAALCMALLEFFLLALSQEARRRGLNKFAGRVMFVFWFTFLGNFSADYSAFVSLTAGDRDARAQIAQVYQMDQDRLAQLDRDIAALQGQLAASEMNMPSAAIAASLSAQQEIAARYEAVQAEVPPAYVRRIARLESARITAERLEALQAERQQAADALRARDAVPQAIHPQFASIAALLGNWVTAEQVRSFLPVILVIAFKSAVIWIFGVLIAILQDIWGQRSRYDDDGSATDAPPPPLPDNDQIDDGLDARNEAAGSRTAPPPPDALPGGRRNAPLADDGEVFDQMDEFFNPS